jgi:uncharacterized protein (TIGR02588 family)
VTLAISVLLLGALVAGLVWLEVDRGDSPVRVEVTPRFDDAYRHGSLWYLPVTVTNAGDRAAELLRVEVSAGEDQSAELEWEFVGGGQSVDGTVAFPERPSEGEVEASVATATDP